ncbi:hypothetical protein FACHB389_13065 [Nostoc calcicola FACHB-389]|nr:CHAT domain-containing protein [Nostoc calcicola FACHB-3891]OKH35186.1 hypothetical protein FACHB389_13065 [Nostoc calcicola FACHB-389]
MSNTVRTILVLAANPINQKRLRLDLEVREIDEGLRRSKHRDYFKLEQKWAVGTDELRRALLDFEPHIVHFCGHGSGTEGLVLEDKETGREKVVSTEALADLFELCKEHVECVVLNACYSEKQANAIVQHIGYVIGMSELIGDKAAVKFSVGFYDALGAGRSVETAYNFGRNAIQLENLPEYLVPIIKKNINAAKNYLRIALAKNRSNPIQGNIDIVTLVAFTNIAYGVFKAYDNTLSLNISRIKLEQLDVIYGVKSSNDISFLFLHFLVFFLACMIAASGILILRRKLWIFSVLVSLWLLFGFPLGTIIGGLTLYSLFRQQTIQEYQLRR